jgi:sortase A
MDSPVTPEIERPPRRRRLVAGVVAALLVAGLVGVVVVMITAGRSPVTVASFDADSATPTTSTPTTTSTTTTSTSTTTTTTTTSTTVATLPLQMTQPIAPPRDVRAAENNPELGRIVIPKIGLDSELNEGIRLTTLDRGPGHWPGTAMPGQIGNVVVAGHRTSHGAEFRHLDALAPGDEVVFSTADGTFTYHVTGTQIVTPDAVWIVDPTDTPTATLFACHPLGSTAKRIVVNLALTT